MSRERRSHLVPRRRCVRGVARRAPRPDRGHLDQDRQEAHRESRRSPTTSASTSASAGAGSPVSAERWTSTYYLQKYTPAPAQQPLVEGQRRQGRGAHRGRADAAARPGRGRRREGRRPLGRRVLALLRSVQNSSLSGLFRAYVRSSLWVPTSPPITVQAWRETMSCTTEEPGAGPTDRVRRFACAAGVRGVGVVGRG